MQAAGRPARGRGLCRGLVASDTESRGPSGVTRVAVLRGGGREGSGNPEPARPARPARPAWLGALSLGGRGRGQSREGRVLGGVGRGPASESPAGSSRWPLSRAAGGQRWAAQRALRAAGHNAGPGGGSLTLRRGVALHVCVPHVDMSRKRPHPRTPHRRQGPPAARRWAGDAALARWPAAILWPGAVLRLVASAFPPAAPGAMNKVASDQKEPGI